MIFRISRRKVPWTKRGLSVWRYRELLPVDNDRFITTLAEGGTGLLHCPRLGRELGLKRLYVKNEGENPIHGARIFQVRGDFDEAMRAVVTLTEHRKGFYLMNSLNPFRLEGQKTLAYEVCDQLDGEVPDSLVLPVGNGGNISAMWKGFGEFQTLGVTKARPRMIGVQAEGAAPIAKAVKRKQDRIEPVTNPRTIASAIRIGSPVNWMKVLHAINESHGNAETVSDKEILEAQRNLASKEGIFVEPASAASIAGLRKNREAGKIDRSDLVVCVTTGHGLKDPSVVDYLPKHEGYTLKTTQLDWIGRLERTL